jgi:hypothetical protein
MRVDVHRIQRRGPSTRIAHESRIRNAANERIADEQIEEHFGEW